MPTYEYMCSKCEHAFEITQPISEPALTVCPRDRCSQKKWGRGKVKRVIVSGAGLIFKGSGFYSTDYRSESYKAGAKKESESKAPPAGEGKATTPKPETKTGAKPGKTTPPSP